MIKCGVCTVIDSVQEIFCGLRVCIRLILIDADDLDEFEALSIITVCSSLPEELVLHLAQFLLSVTPL
jgi:hypothetical protein